MIKNNNIVNEQKNVPSEKIITDILMKIKEAWQSPIVLRRDIEKFSFGLVTVKSIQVLGCRGQGVKESITINGKVAYTTENAIKWLESMKKKNQENLTKMIFF